MNVGKFIAWREFIQNNPQLGGKYSVEWLYRHHRREAFERGAVLILNRKRIVNQEKYLEMLTEIALEQTSAIFKSGS